MRQLAASGLCGGLWGERDWKLLNFSVSTLPLPGLQWSMCYTSEDKINDKEMGTSTPTHSLMEGSVWKKNNVKRQNSTE